jgi:hypothetical protein
MLLRPASRLRRRLRRLLIRIISSLINTALAASFIALLRRAVYHDNVHTEPWLNVWAKLNDTMNKGVIKVFGRVRSAILPRPGGERARYVSVRAA